MILTHRTSALSHPRRQRSNANCRSAQTGQDKLPTERCPATSGGTTELAEATETVRVQALVDYYRLAAGEHPDWDECRSPMVSYRRVLMRMKVDKVCGAEMG